MRPDPPYASYSDLELMFALCSTRDDQGLYSEVVRRFLPELQQRCLNKCKLQHVDPHVGEQIAHQVFERLRQYKSFDRNKTAGRTDRAAVLAYLTRCASRLFINHHNENKRKEDLPETYLDELRAEASATDPARLQEIKERTARAISKLTEREKAVLITDLEFKRHTKYLPDDVIAELSARLGVKPDTIRKLRQTARQKLQQALDES